MIPVEHVSELAFAESGGDEHSNHISAASSLVRIGDTLFVVADDELQLGVFTSLGRDEGTRVTLMKSEPPESEEARKEDKADLESLIALPSAEGWPHGALFALGSGSGPKRNKGALIPLDADGAPTQDRKEVDLSPLYDHIRKSIPELNIEGAVVLESSVWLLQRGDNAEGRNAVLTLDLAKMQRSIASGSIDKDVLGETRFYDLGRLKGVDLAFSDASLLEDGRIAISASAEDSKGGSDGGYVGSALGVMTPDGDVISLEPVDLDVKLEGMTARIEGDQIVFMLVTDADAPEVPSPLLEAKIPAGAL